MKRIRIFLDESYDNANTYFLLGALFCPDSKAIHKKIDLRPWCQSLLVSDQFILPMLLLDTRKTGLIPAGQ